MFDPAESRYVSLVTFRKNGNEVRTPVWIAPLANRHYVFSEAKAGKIKRLSHTAAVKIADCDYRGHVQHDVWLSGQARIVDDPQLITQVYQSFMRKYGLIMRVTNFLARVSGRYHRRAIIEITLD